MSLYSPNPHTLHCPPLSHPPRSLPPLSSVPPSPFSFLPFSSFSPSAVLVAAGCPRCCSARSSSPPPLHRHLHRQHHCYRHRSYSSPAELPSFLSPFSLHHRRQHLHYHCHRRPCHSFRGAAAERSGGSHLHAGSPTSKARAGSLGVHRRDSWSPWDLASRHGHQRGRCISPEDRKERKGSREDRKDKRGSQGENRRGRKRSWEDRKDKRGSQGEDRRGGKGPLEDRRDRNVPQAFRRGSQGDGSGLFPEDRRNFGGGGSSQRAERGGTGRVSLLKGERHPTDCIQFNGLLAPEACPGPSSSSSSPSRGVEPVSWTCSPPALGAVARGCSLTLVCWWSQVLCLLLHLLRTGQSRRQSLTRLPCLLLWLCVVTTMVVGCLGSPWIEEDAGSVKLRAKVCQPVPEQHLRARLGASFDPSRMSNEDPRNSGKRSDPSSAPELEETALDSYYMEDDPGAGEYVSEDFVDIVASRDGGEEEEDWYRREEEVKKAEDGGLEVDEKDVEEEGRFYQKKRVGKVDPFQDQPKSRDRRPDPDRYLYMRRRRRGASPGDERLASTEDGKDREDSDSEDSVLPLRLLLSGRNRKLRRKLKKAFRKKAKKLGKKPPPWTCNMTKVWGRLKDDYFPRYLLDGRCATDKCFYRLYDCVPQKYRVKVLKRDPDYCNPLPALGTNTTYEQKWSVLRYYVTVGCNCEASDPVQSGGHSRAGLRRNS